LGDAPHHREMPPVPEIRQSDPFSISENGADIYEAESLTETYGREADVYSLAGFMGRASAFVIDIALVFLIALFAYFTGLFMLYGFDFGSYDTGDLMMPLYLALFLLSSTYFIFFHAFGGMTVGKMVMGIKLINKYGEGIGIWDAFLRWIGYYISGAFLCAGFLWSLVDSECQTWHDKIAGTYVIKD
ncbi:MAG TPA: RDD family protein, partial [Thermodesulfobacteriota bacterium]|nr:RDD family protein [Thermodesulfobacteriota bacterium]